MPNTNLVVEFTAAESENFIDFGGRSELVSPIIVKKETHPHIKNIVQ